MGYFVPKLLEEAVDARFNVIAGYQGGNEIDLAVEKGEIQCRSLSTEAYFSREPFAFDAGRMKDAKGLHYLAHLLRHPRSLPKEIAESTLHQSCPT
jgi:hypothetical protein